MLNNAPTPDVGEVQRSRVTPCLHCGVMVPYKTTNRVYCPVCSGARRKESQRKAAEVQRRKRGVAPLKGTEAKCDRCAVPIIRTGITHRFCIECSPIVALEYSREYQRRKHRADGREQIGTEKECANCAARFRKAKRGLQIYCAACRKLQKAGKLPSLRASIARNYRKRYATEPKFAISSRMRRALRHSLSDAKAGRSWELLVGYTIVDLMRHLERQFLKGMSWDNRNKWQIDHIQPLASFTFTSAEDPEFRAAWALSNLRPLWAVANYEKRAKRLFLL